MPPSLKQFFLPSLVIKRHAMLNIHSPRQITFSLYFLLRWIHFRFACGATKFETILSSDAGYQTSCHVKYTFPTSNYISLYFLLRWIHFWFAFFGSATKFKTILSSVAGYQTSCHVKYTFPTSNYIFFVLPVTLHSLPVCMRCHQV